MPTQYSTAETMALTRAMQRWSLVRPVPIAETPSSHVYKVLRPSGSPAALKLLKPGAGGDESRGGALLAWYGGDGAAQIYGLAPDAVLLQWLDGEALGDFARSGHDDAATGILCDVVARLHAPRAAAPPELMPLRERFAALFKTGPGAWPRQGRDSVIRAIGIAHRLFDDSAAPAPLHGDVHHDNIINAGGKWLAIDPKGVLGDPAYDYANSFQNPVGANVLVLDPVRVASHAAAIAQRTGIDRRHLLAWAAAHAALSGAWHLEDGNTPIHQVTILPLLVAAFDAA